MVSICYINFHFFEIEIAHPRIYNDFGGRYVSAFLSGARYLFEQNLQGATEQTLSAFSHYKKRVGLLDLLFLSPFSENKANS